MGASDDDCDDEVDDDSDSGDWDGGNESIGIRDGEYVWDGELDSDGIPDGDWDGENETVGAPEGIFDIDGEVDSDGISDGDFDFVGEMDIDGWVDTVGSIVAVGASDGKGETEGFSVGYELGERVLCRSHSTWFIDLNLMQSMEPLISSLSTAYHYYKMYSTVYIRYFNKTKQKME